MKLDKYYTKTEVASWCYEKLTKTLPSVEEKYFIEPSAGNGDFYDLLPKERRIGIDIAPHHKGLLKHDFLKWQPNKIDREKYVVIGNPPFGHRSDLAIKFFNHSALMAETIGFIVPRQFQKFSVHSRLSENFRLIKEYELDENSFYIPYGKDYSIRCVFQVWTSKNTRNKNLRLLNPPPTKHEHFEMFQYNNTPQALKFFKMNWDFAVPRQGYEDYTRRETNAKRCEKNKQWIFFKPKNEEIHERLWNFDFINLAKKNTMIYGFGKADVVMEYKKLYNA